jgi:hypothetical protein
MIVASTLEGKSLPVCLTPFGLYLASRASRVSGRGQAGLGKSKLLLYVNKYAIYAIYGIQVHWQHAILAE